jgi:hypothetical protein
MFKELVDQIINALLIKILNVVLTKVQNGDLDAFINVKVNDVVESIIAPPAE